MSTMEWVNVVVALLSGGLAGGLAIGVTRGHVQAMHRELTTLQQDLRELRSRLDRIANGH